MTSREKESKHEINPNTSEQDAVILLLHRDANGLPEPVHDALQRLINAILPSMKTQKIQGHTF